MSGERRTFVVCVVLCAVIASAVSAVVGAMTYAGWYADLLDAEHQCECCS